MKVKQHRKNDRDRSKTSGAAALPEQYGKGIA